MSKIDLGLCLSQGATCKVYDLRLRNMRVILKRCRQEHLGNIHKLVGVRHDNIERIARILIMPETRTAYIISERLDMTLFEYKLKMTTAARPTPSAARSAASSTDLPLLTSQQVLEQCKNGLSFLHNQLGLIHADVKNNNIMLHLPSGRLKLIDFSNTIVQGAPQQIDGFEQTLLTMCHVDLYRDPFDVGFKLDMWALAMTLFWFEFNEHFLVRLVRNRYVPTLEQLEALVRRSKSARLELAADIEHELAGFASGPASSFKRAFFATLRADRA